MRHQQIADIGAKAVLTQLKAPTLSRRERLERWAELLDREPHRKLRALLRLEFVAASDREHMREDNSPISVAFADPVLRGAGLEGDTLGDAQKFFELSSEEAHQLLCDCHYLGQMNGGTVARRLRASLNPPLAQRLLRGWFGS